MTTINETQILRLRDEAGAAGDDEMYVICCRALGYVGADDLGDHRLAGALDALDMTREDALAECENAIANA